MANQYLYDLTDTWNNVATTFDAIKINVTDTASAAGSKLLNLQVGGSAKFTVQKDGAVALTGAVTGATNITASGTVTADLLTVTKTTANTAAISSTGYSLTGSNASSLVDLAGTWNTTGNPTAIKLNVTNTASGASSLLMDLQVGGSSLFAVTKAGAVSLPAGTAAAPAIRSSASTGTGIYFSGNNLLFSADGANRMGLDGLHNITVSAISVLQWANSGGSIGGTVDLIALRDASATLAIRNGTNAQTFRVYNTFTDASNYERGKLEWASNVLRIGTEKGGTGSARALEFQTDGVTRYTLASGGGTSLSYVAPAIGRYQLAFVPDLVNFPSATGIAFSIENGGSAMRVHNITNNESGMAFRNGSVDLASNGLFRWTNTNFNPTATIDLTLARDGVGTLAQRTGTAAQTFNIYNTYTSSTNYERLSIEAQSGASVRIRTNKGSGGGTAQALELGTDATTALTLTTAQKAEFAATIKTAAPSGGTAAEWKLGTVATVTPTSPDRTIEVEIGGVTYYLHAKTTNN